MYKKDLALNKLQWLMCHKTQPNQIYPFLSSMLLRPHKVDVNIIASPAVSRMTCSSYLNDFRDER